MDWLFGLSKDSDIEGGANFLRVFIYVHASIMEVHEYGNSGVSRSLAAGSTLQDTHNRLTASRLVVLGSQKS